MNEPKPESIVVDGQWIELERTEDDPPSEGVLSLKEVASLPFAQEATITHPDTGTPLPIPFGSLAGYAEYLSRQWNDDSIHVRIALHHSMVPTMSLEEMIAQEPGTHLSLKELQKGLAEGEFRPLKQHGDF